MYSSRRNFLKNASLAVASTAVAPKAMLSANSVAGQEKSRVVVVHDPSRNIQNMVDNAVMHLTRIADKGKAYEALFPNGVTSSTSIAVKTGGPSRSNVAGQVDEALKNGLGSMLGGTFPKGNITVLERSGSRNTNPKIEIGGDTYTFCDAFVDADFIINRAPCWTHTDWENQGITCALKNMMTVVNGNLNGGFHNTFQAGRPQATSGISCWGQIHAHSVIKPKLVLVLTDAIGIRWSGGPGGAIEGYADKIIATKDTVANDYICIQILKEKGMNAKRTGFAEEVIRLAAKDEYGIGTNDPAQMDLVELRPPYSDPEPAVKPARPTGLKVAKE
jgi:hypothetical protein